MEKVKTYEHYSEILKTFKQDKPRCSTNKLLTKDEITALIEAEKLYYAEIDGVLWFFVNEGYYYSANFYVPADTPIQIHKQDMDVLVELTGNQSRYNEQWEQELLAAGCEKRDKREEYACQLDDEVIGYVQEQLKVLRAFWTAQGFAHRKAVKADYPELRRLWEEMLGKHRYTVNNMTDAELEEMERHGRCDVVCDPKGKIGAACIYEKNNRIAYAHITASYYPGLGAWPTYETYLGAYQEGCVKRVSWIRTDNLKSIGMAKHLQQLTGKFYWQFICRA